jgi:hypothetical protein
LLRKLKIELPYDLAILGIHPKELQPDLKEILAPQYSFAALLVFIIVVVPGGTL